MASRILLACAALQFPQYRVRPTMIQFIELLRKSSSWRVRLDVLLPLQGKMPAEVCSLGLERLTRTSPFPVFYFHHLYFLDDDLVSQLVDQLCDLLRDPKIEVREAAASTLSGIIRCSQRSAINSLINRFMKVLRATKIPKRRDAQGNEVAGYQEALVAARESPVVLFPSTASMLVS